MARILKLLMSSGSKKGTQVNFCFSLKCPGKRTPSKFPNRAPMEIDTCFNGILHLSRKLYKNSSKEEGPKKEAPLHVPQKRAPYKRRRPFPSLINISFEVPNEEPPLKDPSMKSFA